MLSAEVELLSVAALIALTRKMLTVFVTFAKVSLSHFGFLRVP
jgi:hypothetical protein